MITSIQFAIPFFPLKFHFRSCLFQALMSWKHDHHIGGPYLEDLLVCVNNPQSLPFKLDFAWPTLILLKPGQFEEEKEVPVSILILRVFIKRLVRKIRASSETQLVSKLQVNAIPSHIACTAFPYSKLYLTHLVLKLG